MIEKVKMEDRGKTFCIEDLIIAMAKKQDEIIDKVNELEDLLKEKGEKNGTNKHIHKQ